MPFFKKIYGFADCMSFQNQLSSELEDPHNWASVLDCYEFSTTEATCKYVTTVSRLWKFMLHLLSWTRMAPICLPFWVWLRRLHGVSEPTQLRTGGSPQLGFCSWLLRIFNYRSNMQVRYNNFMIVEIQSPQRVNSHGRLWHLFACPLGVCFRTKTKVGQLRLHWNPAQLCFCSWLSLQQIAAHKSINSF